MTQKEALTPIELARELGAIEALIDVAPAEAQQRIDQLVARIGHDPALADLQQRLASGRGIRAPTRAASSGQTPPRPSTILSIVRKVWKIFVSAMWLFVALIILGTAYLAFSVTKKTPPKAGAKIPPSVFRGKLANHHWRRCYLGSGYSCNKIGMRYLLGKGVKKHKTIAQKYFQMACRKGTGPGCNNLGRLFHLGATTLAERKKAVWHYSKACQQKDMIGCSNLASLHQKGFGTRRSLPTAQAYFRIACQGGYAPACRNLGLSYEHNKRSLRDAIKWYTHGCKAKDPGSCRNAAMMHQRGEGTRPDCKRADTLYQKACQLGDKALCSYRCQRVQMPRTRRKRRKRRKRRN